MNQQLYNMNLQCASKWPRTWPLILDTIDLNLQNETDELYVKLNKKLETLKESHNRFKTGLLHYFPKSLQ
jgi:hypothetical protein